LFCNHQLRQIANDLSCSLILRWTAPRNIVYCLLQKPCFNGLSNLNLSCSPILRWTAPRNIIYCLLQKPCFNGLSNLNLSCSVILRWTAPRNIIYCLLQRPCFDVSQIDKFVNRAYRNGYTSNRSDFKATISNRDKKLWSRIINDDKNALHNLLPSKLNRPLRRRGHDFELPIVKTERFKNAFINRCLFNFI
jgi:hypothetical protein